jgi:hypothetical protein
LVGPVVVAHDGPGGKQPVLLTHAAHVAFITIAALAQFPVVGLHESLVHALKVGHNNESQLSIANAPSWSLQLLGCDTHPTATLLQVLTWQLALAHVGHEHELTPGAVQLQKPLQLRPHMLACGHMICPLLPMLDASPVLSQMAS